jgi:hypothetical protein
MSQQLKPCPFCKVDLYECTYDLGKIRYAHEANGCTLSRKFVQGDLQFEAWNRRADDPQSMTSEALAAHIAALQQILREKQEVQSW